jgi:hypothetical protein
MPAATTYCDENVQQAQGGQKNEGVEEDHRNGPSTTASAGDIAVAMRG